MSEPTLTAAQRRYRDYLKTPHWQAVRRRILSRAQDHCEWCLWFCGSVERLPLWAIDHRIEDLTAQDVPPCGVCGYYCQFRDEDDNSGRVWLEIHHLTYERIGQERDEDLVALCCYCHEEATERQQFRAQVRQLIPGLPKDLTHGQLFAVLFYYRLQEREQERERSS